MALVAETGPGMRITLEELNERVVSLLTSHSVPAEEARVGARVCIDAELRGHASHGVRLLNNVIAEYDSGSHRRNQLCLTHETPASGQVDGGFHLSLYVHDFATTVAINKALEVGISIVSVRNAGVSGALGYFAERMALAGLVGIALNSTPITVVAPGSYVPTLGTNPLALAVPRATQDPVVLDMATSAIAFNQVKGLRDLGERLPEGVAVDAEGRATTDPAEAIDPSSGRGRILPFGGHRGFGLAFMLELLVSACVTGRVADLKRRSTFPEPADFSGLYLAYQPSLVGDRMQAREATEDLLQELVIQGTRVPGEVGRARREECQRHGFVDLSHEAAAVLDL